MVDQVLRRRQTQTLLLPQDTNGPHGGLGLIDLRLVQGGPGPVHSFAGRRPRIRHRDAELLGKNAPGIPPISEDGSDDYSHRLSPIVKALDSTLSHQTG